MKTQHLLSMGAVILFLIIALATSFPEPDPPPPPLSFSSMAVDPTAAELHQTVNVSWDYISPNFLKSQWMEIMSLTVQGQLFRKVEGVPRITGGGIEPGFEHYTEMNNSVRAKSFTFPGPVTVVIGALTNDNKIIRAAVDVNVKDGFLKVRAQAYQENLSYPRNIFRLAGKPEDIYFPVFFAIYKVLYVTIEMRQAKFFGWVKDLSVSDPTTIFNLFGLLNFTPPSWLHIGVWPILMSITMFLQQQMGTKPADPIQAQMMKFLPLMFLFMFSGFPVGLLIYWTWSNILSILQQWYTNKNILKN